MMKICEVRNMNTKILKDSDGEIMWQQNKLSVWGDLMVYNKTDNFLALAKDKKVIAILESDETWLQKT